MHILYLDESGTHGEARHFVLAGLSVFERETYFLARELEQLQADYFPGRQQPVNLRASSLRAPDGRVEPPFDELTSTRRVELLIRIYSAIAASRVRLFGIAIEKAQFTGSHYERGFEDIVSRFDQMLSRMGRESEPQRGLIVVAESSYRENIASLAPSNRPTRASLGRYPQSGGHPVFRSGGQYTPVAVGRLCIQCGLSALRIRRYAFFGYHYAPL